jgi:ABC-2 type transport system ATP-binding protein
MDHGRLIALGSSQELKDKLSGGTFYQIDLSDDVRHYAELLRDMACVKGIEIIEQSICVELACWECLSEVVSALNGAPVRRISLKERTLEEVFINLTGKGVRE